jgi:hypothetical protein
MHDVIGFVDGEGNQGIRRLAASAGDFDDLLAHMRDYRRRPGEPPIYVLYTPDMLLKYQAMRTLGTPARAAAAQPGSLGIRWLQCERIVDEKLHCAGQTNDRNLLSSGSTLTFASRV